MSCDMTAERKPSTIDDYLKSVPEDRRRALEVLRAKIRSIVPDAEECISYRIPAFRLNGVVVAGFDAHDPRSRHRSLRPDEGLAPFLVGQAVTDCASAQADQGPHRGDEGVIRFEHVPTLPATTGHVRAG